MAKKVKKAKKNVIEFIYKLDSLIYEFGDKLL